MELLLKPWVATCAETQTSLSDYLDGELQGRRERRVRRHLSLCPHCRGALRTLRRAVEGLRALGRADLALSPPAAETVAAVVARLRPG